MIPNGKKSRYQQDKPRNWKAGGLGKARPLRFADTWAERSISPFGFVDLKVRSREICQVSWHLWRGHCCAWCECRGRAVTGR